ncbi:MAG: 6-phosphogluconolactonase [Deltaproteobacteria bacterium]|nr:6-phosphogluconolactonase [Deltaproteobacteria bacterium]
MNQIFADYEALSRGAAEFFVAEAREALASRGVFRVALSGGNTPERMFAILAAPPLSAQVAWDRVAVFWSDERCVPPTDERRNSLHARRAWLDRAPAAEAQVHPVDCQDDPGRAARAYELAITARFAGEAPRFDLIFLGLGADGHTASLFPGHDQAGDAGRLVREILTGPGEVDRVTFTPGLLNQARVVAFLVSGPEKAQVVREIQEGPRDPGRRPAQLVQPSPGRLVWLLDRAAARELPI